MSPELAIQVENLSKCYEIYQKPKDRLKQFTIPKVNRLLNRQEVKYYREFWALKDVTLEVETGQTVGIIGRNGSGKSTLLQLICGTLFPTYGTVQTAGRIAALLELGSGFNPDFTGIENVYLNGAILGMTNEEISDRLDSILAFADIGDFIHQPVKTYSSGMFVRLAFSVNVMSQPRIMIVDEALAVGDMAFQAKCMTALRRIQDDGVTILFVSHDINSIKSLCSKAIYLEKGKIRETGKASLVSDLYMRAIREEMNSDVARPAPTSHQIDQTNGLFQGGAWPSDKNVERFRERVSQFRYGAGGAQIQYCDLFDTYGQPTISAEFNQEVTIKLYIYCENEVSISVNYYIQDDKKNLIIGAGFPNVNEPFLSCQKNSYYLVSYTTRLPLQDGNYSMQLQLTKPNSTPDTAEFLDVIEDAIVFQVQRNKDSRIWTKVYVENSIEVKKL